jgi:endonuclease YncB( thermonuclease family)
VTLRSWLLLLACCGAAAAQAAVFRGTVTHVTDGDTLWVRPAAGGAPVEIRLLDVDAPEGCQRFGAEAKQALARRVLNETVRVRTRGVDDYDRVLARIELRQQDVGGWMVRQGYAWSMRFRDKPGPYARLEQQARAQRAGLWATPGALEPRSFRKRFGRCQ